MFNLIKLIMDSKYTITREYRKLRSGDLFAMFPRSPFIRRCESVVPVVGKPLMCDVSYTIIRSHNRDTNSFCCHSLCGYGFIVVPRKK